MSQRNTAFSLGTLAVIAAGAVTLFVVRQPAPTRADDPPEVLRLLGTVRDFKAAHPDFDITDSTLMGHHAWNVAEQLSDRGRPAFTGTGSKVIEQWYDKDGHPIMPYTGGLGLPGGHFDVDVFEEDGYKKKYHKHEYDDSYDVTYVDVVHDERLLLDEVTGGTAYPNDLRIEFFNPHHASGIFLFEAGGVRHEGLAQNGFTTTYDPAELTELRVDFATLLDFRRSSPGDVQGDRDLRNDAFSIRLFDTVTGERVYELSIYWHESEDFVPDADDFVEAEEGDDACGNEIKDEVGAFGSAGPGAVTHADTFEQWFRDELGVNLSRPLEISLYRNGEGVYEMLSDDFHPIDGLLHGNEDDSHNNFFTYVITATFTYNACTNQFFEFEGNDDCWVFINRERVIDIGGVATPSSQFVALDRLDLVDGQTYPFHFFFAHRRDSYQSSFNMRTNILLQTPTSVPVSSSYD